MTPRIARINEAVLFSLGFDRVTVEALRNIVRVTGSESDSPTVPEVVKQVDGTALAVDTLRTHLEAVKSVLEALQFVPEPIQPDLSGIESAALAPLARMVEIVEHLDTEVRQIAEQQAAMARQIQDIQQGIPL